MKRIRHGIGIILVFALISAGHVFAGSVPGRKTSFNLTGGIATSTSLVGILFTVGAQGVIPAGKALSVRPEIQMGYIFGFGLLAIPAVLVDIEFKNSFVGAGVALATVLAEEKNESGVLPAWKIHAGVRRGRVIVTGYMTVASMWESYAGLVGITIGYSF